LYPFNSDEIKQLLKPNTIANLKTINEGENEHYIDVNPDDKFSWHRILLDFQGSNRDVEISNFRLVFADGFVGSIRGAVDNGYIQPLVVVSNRLAPAYRLFPNIIDIINDNGTTGLGPMYP